MKTSKFLSNYLKAAQVQQPLTVTVARITQEVVGSGEKKGTRLVAYFKEIEQGLVLNKTNMKFLNKHFSPTEEESDDWIGKQVVLYCDPNVSFQGDVVEGLRLRLPV